MLSAVVWVLFIETELTLRACLATVPRLSPENDIYDVFNLPVRNTGFSVIGFLRLAVERDLRCLAV